MNKFFLYSIFLVLLANSSFAEESPVRKELGDKIDQGIERMENSEKVLQMQQKMLDEAIMNEDVTPKEAQELQLKLNVLKKKRTEVKRSYQAVKKDELKIKVQN